MENYEIIKLEPSEFYKCANIWDLKNNSKVADSFVDEMQKGNRVTFIYKNQDGDFLGEASIVFEMDDTDYTIKGKRIYFSHFHIKDTCRGKGIGKILANYVFDYCKKLGYSEITLAVTLDNFRAIRLYHKLNFRRLILLSEDESGKFMVLLKRLK